MSAEDYAGVQFHFQPVLHQPAAAMCSQARQRPEVKSASVLLRVSPLSALRCTVCQMDSLCLYLHPVGVYLFIDRQQWKKHSDALVK